MMPNKFSKHWPLILGLLSVGLAVYAVFASVLAIKSLTKLQHAEWIIDKSDADKSNKTQVFKEKVVGEGSAEHDGPRLPIVQQITSSTSILITMTTERSDLGSAPLSIFSINADDGTATHLDSLAQNMSVWDMATSTSNGVLIIEFGFYAPGNIRDYFSLDDGSLLLSISNEWDHVLHAKKAGKALDISLNYSCPVYDESKPERLTATGTVEGLRINGKNVDLSSPRSVSCDLVDSGFGLEGPLLLRRGDYTYNPQKEDITFELSSGDIVSIMLSPNNFGRVVFSESPR